MRHGRVPPAPLGDARDEHAVSVGAGPWPPAPLEVALVAAAVDEGRALAARARRAGAGVVVLRVPGAEDAGVIGRLAAWAATEPGRRDPAGPLSALRRLGDGPLAVAVGVVLGAGEQGLACRCDDRAAEVAGAL